MDALSLFSQNDDVFTTASKTLDLFGGAFRRKGAPNFGAERKGPAAFRWREKGDKRRTGTLPKAAMPTLSLK